MAITVTTQPAQANTGQLVKICITITVNTAGKYSVRYRALGSINESWNWDFGISGVQLSAGGTQNNGCLTQFTMGSKDATIQVELWSEVGGVLTGPLESASAIVKWINVATGDLLVEVLDSNTLQPLYPGVTSVVTADGLTGVLQINGSYFFNAITAKLYTVTVTPTGYPKQLAPVDVVAGVVNNVKFYFVAISGPPAPPAPNGTLNISVTDAVTNKLITTGIVFTDSLSSGYPYTFSLPAGTYTVTATAAGYANQIKPALVQSGLPTNISFTLTAVVVPAPPPPPPPATFTIIIDVFNAATGSPLTGWTMNTPGVGSLTFTADAVTGSVRSTGVPGGTYTTTVSKVGYEPKSLTWTANSSSVNEGADTIHFSILLTPLTPSLPPSAPPPPPAPTDLISTITQFLPLILIIGLITPLLRGGERRD